MRCEKRGSLAVAFFLVGRRDFSSLSLIRKFLKKMSCHLLSAIVIQNKPNYFCHLGQVSSS